MHKMHKILTKWNYINQCYRSIWTCYSRTYAGDGIEFTEKTVTLHLKRSYITVFGEFIIEDINTEDEYSFNGLSGQTISGDSFRIINDGLLLWFNGNNYTRQ